jgi:hypothetical protein
MDGDMDSSLKKVFEEVCSIWLDTNFINFLEKYKPESFAALFDFISEPNYHTLGMMSDTLWFDMPQDGRNRTIPWFINDLLSRCEDLELKEER